MSRLSKVSGSATFGSVASTSQEGPEEEAPASASNRTLNVTMLSSEWKSTKGGLSTVSRELAIQCAKHPNVEVSVYIPKCSEEDKKIAASHNVQLMEAQELPGYEAVDWLASVPENHAMDCIIGHGVPLGRQIPLIKRHNRHCKWIQIVHTAPEELGMYKTYADAIAKGEKKHQTEVRLCEMADQVVAVGPKLADAYSRSLRPSQKDQKVLTLTPGIFTEFSEVKQTTEEGNKFVVLVFGRGDSEDFELKGYDIAANMPTENYRRLHASPGQLVNIPNQFKKYVRGPGGDNLRNVSTLTGAEVSQLENYELYVTGEKKKVQHAEYLLRTRAPPQDNDLSNEVS
ncbi:uncharacterized protein LOC110069400 [Orbicella faveolata]|uniref:uncharacterized protein LOC110069400 n=1 Tax=Orbicella faveolata TaxID=48498 RepID=UPI0009E1F972|nr:uncharacterized protein LOC110069400 [Orbicella faveolata]